jgi:hypothetical protein
MRIYLNWKWEKSGLEPKRTQLYRKYVGKRNRKGVEKEFRVHPRGVASNKFLMEGVE